jgi:hypothetical protein
MKELTNLNKIAESIEINQIISEEETKTPLKTGSIIPHQNHKVWEIDPIDLSIKEALYNTLYNVTWWEALLYLKGEFSIAKRVITNPNFVYITALSKKTALDRFLSKKGSAQKELNKHFII